ncbi:MAG: hypothetical protein PW792_14500 [Acidobacteriaceae bacterium]|nr:hypothetical protein [Acidobacteriaceae bacterium]
MAIASTSSDDWKSPASNVAVLAQLELLLASPLFNQSKRYPAFLRYVVEKTLAGAEDDLKERTIGVEVFGRQPTYDTNLDPTVRLTAAEVRKRLAQYYQQAEHVQQLHIEIRAGSYVPTFVGQQIAEAPLAPLPEPVAAQALLISETPQPTVLSSSAPQTPATKRAPLAYVAGLLLVAALATWFWTKTRSSQAESGIFWSAILQDPNPALLVVPDLSQANILPRPAENPDTSILAHITDSHLVDFNDSLALSKLSGKLGQAGKPFTLKLSSDATYSDLQLGPTVLIGAADNPWSLRLLQPLPFSVAQRGDSWTYDILRRDKPAEHSWFVDFSQPYTHLQQDYGIVARLSDTMTGHPVLIVAGLGQNGTTAAVRLLTDPELQKVIEKMAPPGWSGKNLEIVFRTQIIQDRFGPPEVVDKAFW